VDYKACASPDREIPGNVRAKRVRGEVKRPKMRRAQIRGSDMNARLIYKPA
jgi:hypothetical protein